MNNEKQINGIPLQKTFSYFNVIVEKNEPDLILPASVPIFLNYKIDKVIGVAQPRYLNSAIICNIFVFESMSGFYPGICFNVHPENELLYLSLGTEQNIDKSILPL